MSVSQDDKMVENAKTATSTSWIDCVLHRDRNPLDNEASAWIGFDVANSCYATVSLATFLPLVLNSYATTQAWVASGRDKPPMCGDITNYAVSCIECRVGEGDLLCTGPGTGRTNCIDLDTPNLSGGINPTSFAFLIISLSCISQLIAFMLFSETADHTDNRKGLLMTSSLVGSLSIILFAFFPESEGSAKYILAALITIISNTAFGMAQVYYNAYLPLISEDLLDKTNDSDSDSKSKFGETLDDIENTLSSYALAGGYWAGVIGLILSIIVLMLSGGMAKDATEYEISSSFRWAIVLSGFWWFFGTLYTIPRFQQRPNIPKPFEWLGSIKQFKKTISNTYELMPKTFTYLILYFAYSDGYSTIAGLGLLYARLDMCANTTSLFIIAMEAPFAAALGNFFFLWLSRKYNYSNKTMVVMILCVVSFLPFWGILGYFTNAIGFRNSWEAYALGAWFGLCLGAIQNFSRTLFIEMIPKSCENEYFAFYELTDKGSSWLGPLVVSALAAGKGTLRVSFIYILIMTLIPAYFLSRIDVNQAKEDTKKYENSLLNSGGVDGDGDGEKEPAVEMVTA
jgi:MFS transporter, UMF1 family